MKHETDAAAAAGRTEIQDGLVQTDLGHSVRMRLGFCPAEPRN